MKNSNTKIKLVARVMLIVLLLAGAVNLAGCNRTTKYVYFPADNIHGSNYLLRSTLTTNSNEYYNSDVEFELSLGMHELSFWGNLDKKSKEQIRSKYPNGTFTLNVILCNSLEDGSFNEQIIKTISEEELFSQEYGYIDTPFFISNGIIYMNSEIITVPQEHFGMNYGQILIKLKLLLAESTGEVYLDRVHTFTIKYHNIDGNIDLYGGEFL